MTDLLLLDSVQCRLWAKDTFFLSLPYFKNTKASPQIVSPPPYLPPPPQKGQFTFFWVSAPPYGWHSFCLHVSASLVLTLFHSSPLLSYKLLTSLSVCLLLVTSLNLSLIKSLSLYISLCLTVSPLNGFSASLSSLLTIGSYSIKM